MEACVKDIKMWMAGNHMKLNDQKMEVITFTAPNVEMNMAIDIIHIGDYIIPPVKCVRDLGVVFDHHTFNPRAAGWSRPRGAPRT